MEKKKHVYTYKTSFGILNECGKYEISYIYMRDDTEDVWQYAGTRKLPDIDDFSCLVV